MSAGRKPLTGAQQDSAWKLARTHGLMVLEQGTQAFDNALFAFCAALRDQHRKEHVNACRNTVAEVMRQPAHAFSQEARAALLAAHDAVMALDPPTAGDA